MASGVRGRAQVRRLLKRLPDGVRQEIVREFDRAGREILPVMKSRAPLRTGATRAGLSYRVLAGSLKLLVGLISTPLGRAKLFYARIQDLGRRGQQVSVARFARGARASGAGTISGGRKRGPVELYTMNVRAMTGKHFVTGSFRPFRNRLVGNLRGIWDRAIARAASGAGGND